VDMREIAKRGLVIARTLPLNKGSVTVANATAFKD